MLQPRADYTPMPLWRIGLIFLAGIFSAAVLLLLDVAPVKAFLLNPVFLMSVFSSGWFLFLNARKAAQ